MDRKELLAILILGVLVAAGALFRVFQMPPGVRRGGGRLSASPLANHRGTLKGRADGASGVPRLLWPHPREDYLPKSASGQGLFAAAERIMSEGFVAITQDPPDRSLFQAAIPVYRYFAARYPDERTVEVARFRIAQALTVTEAYEEAARAYDEFLALHRDSQLRAMALLWSGDSHMRAGHPEVARERLEQVIATGPVLLAEEARRRLEQMQQRREASSDGP